MKSIVKLNEFFSVGIKLLERAAIVIHETRKSSTFTGISKGTDKADVFTMADMHIQNTVKYNLSQLYPRAKIIGEEDDMEFDTGTPYIMPDQIDKNHISQKVLLASYNVHKGCYREYLREMEEIHQTATTEASWNFFEFPDELYEEDMVIWIDPLDGTQGFVEGHLNHITSMIGLSIDGRPRAGIIHKPFYDQSIHMQRTYFGTPECGVFIKDRFPAKLRRLQRVSASIPFDQDVGIASDDYKLWICGAMNRNQDKMDELFRALDPVNVGRVAGAGNKIVFMLDSMADYYINFVPGFKYWDMCASEALIEAKMGICVDASGKPLKYDHEKEDYTIHEGIQIAKNMNVYKIVQQRCMDGLGMSMHQFYEEVRQDSLQKSADRAARQQRELEIQEDLRRRLSDSR